MLGSKTLRSKNKYFRLRTTCGLILLAIVALTCSCVALHAQTALSSSSALYARVVRLSHNADASLNGGIVASVTAFPSTGTEESIYASSNGSSFTKIGAIKDADFNGGLCCGTLFELPQQVGTLPAGTLLWSGSVGQSSTTAAMQLKIYASQDQGKSWSYLSNCAKGTAVGTTGGGLWEPEFTVASDGALVCIYSDETVSGHSQLLRQVRSYDGITWQDAQYTVASSISSDRPGMAMITQLPSGLYFMSYELCGPAGCAAYTRTSADGWNWGDATNVGRRVATADGLWLAHTPTNAWSPSAASSNGTILLNGQMLYNSSGSVASGNGSVIFTNHSSDGSGSWEVMPAPIKISSAYDNYCPNYSSPLLPSADGQSVLEFASNYSGSICTMYYASSAVLAGTLAPNVTVSPAASSLTTAQSLSVTVQVAGNGSVTPLGSVILSDGNSYSASATLSNGKATFSIPANSLLAGTATLTATYGGDANYASAAGTQTVTVTQAVTPAIAVANATLSLQAGATTGNSVAVVVTPSGGFTGNVTLKAAISNAPSSDTTYYPTLSFGDASTLAITSDQPATAQLKIATTARTSTSASAAHPSLRYVALLMMPLLFIRRKWRHVSRAGCVLLCAIMLSGLAACGGGASGTNASTGTPAGTYLITITATSGLLSSTGTVTLNVQ